MLKYTWFVVKKVSLSLRKGVLLEHWRDSPWFFRKDWRGFFSVMYKTLPAYFKGILKENAVYNGLNSSLIVFHWFLQPYLIPRHVAGAVLAPSNTNNNCNTKINTLYRYSSSCLGSVRPFFDDSEYASILLRKWHLCEHDLSDQFALFHPQPV